MQFPHLFLRPEIIITFFCGDGSGVYVWGGGGGGGVRHRSPRNSGLTEKWYETDWILLIKLIWYSILFVFIHHCFVIWLDKF